MLPQRRFTIIRGVNVTPFPVLQRNGQLGKNATAV
jgi:hypothetical protein